MKLKHAFAGFAAIVFLASAGPAVSGEMPKIKETAAPTTALFLGNSFIYYNNSLHNHFRNLTKSIFTENAKKYFFKSMTISGSYLKDHAMSAENMIKKYTHKKKKGPWDLVILQGQSREPINKKKMKSFMESAKKLDKLVRDAGSKTVLFMTWAYKEKPEMGPALRDAYTKAGNELNALVVPVGFAFDIARAKDPKAGLWAKDKKHPSVLGTYLAANVFFATFYGKSPEGATYTAGLSPEQVKFAQSTAWNAVQQYFGK